MLSVILTILTVLGRSLLLLLLSAVILLLVVLFLPITYRIKGERQEGKTRLAVKGSWLFGLLGIRYDYPDPGTLRVRILWKTLKRSASGEKSARVSKEKENGKDDADGQEETASSGILEKNGTADGTASEAPETETDSAGEAVQQGIAGRISRKTDAVRKKLMGIRDKIGEISEKLSYYNALLHEDDTVALWQHTKRVLGKVLRSIRPRRIRGQLTFGTGAPDTTGYLFGVYGVFSPAIGPRFQVTPDFTQKILEGQLDLAGHITLFILTWNGLRLFLDRKLHRFLRRMKAGRRTDAQKAQENIAEKGNNTQKENNTKKENTTDA